MDSKIEGVVSLRSICTSKKMKCVPKGPLCKGGWLPEWADWGIVAEIRAFSPEPKANS